MARANTPGGDLKGLQGDRHQAYLGIPFAQPPTGRGRFCAPRPASGWDGVRDATRYGASCPQGQHAIPGMAASGPRDEDCLYLNVFTPRADDGARPVLFWIHGGGFRLGSGSEPLYHGGPLAERGDVVVVTVHYRLAALGYACFGDAGRAWGASANCGQLDMIQALNWVRANISSFGGDPSNVTVFGESAGAAAVGTLLAMPDASGLIHKAIMQSGTGRATSFDAASRYGLGLLDALGVAASDHAAIMEVDVNAIVVQSGRLAGALGAGTPGPAVDGTTLHKPPRQANADGESADIPLLIGTNRDEMKLFNVVPDRTQTGDATLLRLVTRAVECGEEAAAHVVASVRESRAAQGLTADNNDVLDTVQSIVQFRRPAEAFALDHVRRQPKTFHYLFTYGSPARRGAFGACHALEMPFVFGTLEAPTQDRFAGTGPAVERLAANMMDAWIAFARSGDPSHPGIGRWPAYDADARPTLVFDVESRVVADPLADERLVVASAQGIK